MLRISNFTLMNYHNKQVGDKGEKLAKEYLEKKGYKFLKQKLRLFCGEIDLLMQQKDTLIIVEVKAKSSDEFGAPQEEVDFFKKKKLVQLGKALWQLYPSHAIRIDVVAVDENDKIEHIIDAVQE